METGELEAMIPNGGLTGVCFSSNKWFFLVVHQSLLRLIVFKYSFFVDKAHGICHEDRSMMDIKPGNGPWATSSSAIT